MIEVSAKNEDRTPEKDDREKNKSTLKIGLESLAVVSQLGMTMAAAVLIGILAGNWLDKKFDTGGILLMIMVGLGIAGGFYTGYRQIIPLKKKKSGQGK